MITHVEGRLVEKSPTYAIIDCKGVGYFLNISLHTYSQLGDDENLRLYTHLVVREDAHTLFGFSHQEERQLFRHLISVSGVGPSTAQMILSSMTPSEAEQAIIEGDATALEGVKGIGAKSAQRIIIDLGDKLHKAGMEIEFSAKEGNNERQEALSALTSLGFDGNKSRKALEKVLKEYEGSSVEELIKAALKHL